jgi:peptidoglycan hydrolase CwlO-like protein
MSHAAYSSLFDEILLNGKILDSATPPGVLSSFTSIYSSLTGITGSIANLQTQIDTDNTDNLALHAGLTGLQSSLDTTNSNLSTLSGSLDTTNSNLSTLSGSLDTTNSNLTTLSGSLDTTKSDVSGLQSSLDTTNSNLTTLSGSLDTTNSNLTTLSGSLDTTNSNLTTLSGSLDTTKSDVSDLQTANQTQDSSINTINSSLESITNNVASLESITTQTTGIVQQHSTDIIALQAYDWSAHNATQNVSLDGRDLLGVNNITCSTLNYTTLNPAIPVPVAFANTYYVDKAGSDSSNGSAEFPFLTIQKAIDVCESTWNGTAREIRVNFGSYSQQLLIKKARIQLTAVGSRYANTACSITGNILVQVSGSVDMFNSQIAIVGFQIVGRVLDTSTSVHTLVLMNCYLYANENAVSQTSSADNRTYMENCTVQAGNTSGTQALLNFTSGGVSLISISITQKSTQSCIILSGTAYFNNCVLSTFTNDNSGATLLPLMQITTSSVASQVVANCGFIYSSSTAKGHTATQCNNVGIYMNWGAGSTAGGLIPLTLLSNTFLLTGTVEGNLIVDALNNYYLFHANCYTGHSNISGQAHLMCGTFNVNKFPLCPAS